MAEAALDRPTVTGQLNPNLWFGSYPSAPPTTECSGVDNCLGMPASTLAPITVTLP